MAQAQTKTTPAKDLVLDTSYEHPALTPDMRRMAAELWEIVQTRADEEGYPLRGGLLWAETDMERVTWVHLAVRCDTPFDEMLAFEDRVWPDYLRWLDQQDEERREMTAHPLLHFASRRGNADG